MRSRSSFRALEINRPSEYSATPAVGSSSTSMRTPQIWKPEVILAHFRGSCRDFLTPFENLMNAPKVNSKWRKNKEVEEDDEDKIFEKLRKEIEVNQDNALSLCTEKVLLARQAHDLIDSHIRRLDEDLNNFAEDLKQEGKIAPDELAVLPPLPLVPKNEKRRVYGTPQSKRIDYRDKNWDRERNRGLDLMPPPGSLKKEFASAVELDQPIDPNEPTYCVCHQVSFGDMIACDNENCQGGEWFHYACVGLTPETRFKGKWFCPTCRLLPH